MVEKDSGLSPDEVRITAELLSRFQPGFLPLDIFHQIARLTVLTSVEMVPFKLDNAGKTQVLLLRRPSDDMFWPNKLHLPGTIVRATDEGENFEGVFQRLLVGEMGNPEVVRGPAIFGTVMRPNIRGKETLVMSWVQIATNPRGGFYPVDGLPEDFIAEELPHLRKAHEHFRSQIN